MVYLDGSLLFRNKCVCRSYIFIKHHNEDTMTSQMHQNNNSTFEYVPYTKELQCYLPFRLCDYMTRSIFIVITLHVIYSDVVYFFVLCAACSMQSATQSVWQSSAAVAFEIYDLSRCKGTGNIINSTTQTTERMNTTQSHQSSILHHHIVYIYIWFYWFTSGIYLRDHTVDMCLCIYDELGLGMNVDARKYALA